METECKKVEQLIEEGVLFPPIDGNHGEKHPKTSDFVDNGIPFILVPDLKDGFVDIENCNFISEAQAQTLSKGFAKTGDVLFTHKATIGKVAIVDTGKYDYIILTPQVTYYRIKNLDVLSNRYLYYYFKSQTFQNTFKLYASSGGTRDYLGIVAQRKLPIIYPNLVYQNKIADILQNYDHLIANNNKRIKVLEQMAENLYKEWFVRFRFPGHENAEFEDKIPKGWEYRKLDKLLDVRYGKDHKNVDDGDIPIFGSGGLMRFGDRSLYDGEVVLIPRKGSLNNIMYYNAPFWTVDTMFYSVPLVPFFAKYAYFLLSSMDMESYNSGAALPSMTTNILYHLRVLVPDERVLKAFDGFISDIFKQINAIEKVNENLIKQRDLLLPRLMSGKLGV